MSYETLLDQFLLCNFFLLVAMAVVSFVVVFLAGVLVGYLWHRDQKQKAFNAELQAKALAIAGKANQYV